jgi:co-chaperonin GroES (HSP10)
MLAVKPVGSKLYVQILQESKTRSGLVIVRKKQEWQEETLQARVVSVGPELSYKEILPGMEVIIAGHAGKWVDPYLTPDQDSMFRIIDQDEVVAYLEEVQDGCNANESGSLQESSEQVPT